MSPAYVINALVTDQGVNMGDHGQDVVRAVADLADLLAELDEAVTL